MSVARSKVGFWYRLAIITVRPVLRILTRRQWRGQMHIPRTGGVIIAANHVSRADPFTCAQFVLDAGRLPRFLAKAELFSTFFVRRVMYGAGQIPVYRYAANAAESLRDAVAALERGECILIYPEGTVTLDPDLWPMRAHTGVARLALASGAPVIPVGQWGAQGIYDRHHRVHLMHRHTVCTAAGPPVDLTAYVGREPTPQLVGQVVDRIMADITQLVSELRGETPPKRAFDPRGEEPRQERSA